MKPVSDVPFLRGDVVEGNLLPAAWAGLGYKGRLAIGWA
ncbi:hypothetical protein GFS31_04770 [Leptolyngbya sp. BL0902]|nr:hypothetical protein GFS31_04770 [Leptolyngbya sp. BL0902]